MSDLLKDLVAVSVATEATDGHWLRNARSLALIFLKTHHSTIQQNAEDAKRLRALERAMEEYINAEDGYANVYAANIKRRADEILREGEPHDQD